ncbi:MAG: hypothetical protein AB1Z38_08255 [Desulfotignum sp.]
MGIRKQTVIQAVILAILLLGPGGAVAETGDNRFLTTGTQSISGGDTPDARQKAVSAALEQAVVQAFAQAMSAREFAANLEFLHTRILPAAEDYIVTYRVLGEVTLKDTYLVGVESRVNAGILEQTLAEAGIVKTDMTGPRILLLIAEQTSQEPLPRYWWGNHPEPYSSHAEMRIADTMMQKRFHVIEWGGNRPDPRVHGIRFKSIYDSEAAVDLGKALNADLVVLGRAGATESINRMGDEKIFDGMIRLDVFDVITGESVAGCEHQASANAGDGLPGDVRAIVFAADAAVADLVSQLDEIWSRKQRKETTFDVWIEGSQFLPRFIALKKSFADIREIESVQPREIGSDQAVLEMVYKGIPERFIQRIMLKKFDGFGIEVVESTDTLVRLRFIDGAGGIRKTEGATVLDSNNEKTSE